MLLEKEVINMNNERILLTMREQKANNPIIKLISKVISMMGDVRLT